ncbi:SH3 domain-containing protein C23A1.17-like [Helianthus annuus]|uniref:SH3 domain-containing protein C23A1.17-like n=1 Tax=Helianthus annuus TaxID=4232 RepID=UPI000B8F1F07|nr:SH3 domain-containing protein C23A1.17-like [Helianthus annuus]
MSSSSDTGVSDTLDPMAIVSDDEILSESEVYTSDTTSTDEDDFQPFAQPDDAPLADGPFDGDLPLVLIPAPIPLAAFPLEGLPLDALSDDDVKLFIEGLPEGDKDGGGPVEDGIPVDDPVVPIAEAPVEEAPSDLSGPYSFEYVASTSFHDRGVQHYSPDADSDMAMSAAPVVPQDFGPEPEVEFVPGEPAPVGPEPVIAHDPIDVPVVALLPDPLPEPDHVDPPVVAPHVVGASVIVPPVSDIPIADAPVLAPPVVDHAPFAIHIDPRYADTLNGCIEDDDDYPPFVLPVTPPAAPVFAPFDIPQFHPHKMPPHRDTRLPTTEAELQERISKAIADYEASRTETSEGSSRNNNNPPNGYTYKQFLDCKPLNFDGTGGTVAFVRWTEKTDSVIRMSKCAPENQVTYVSGLFLDGALS